MFGLLMIFAAYGEDDTVIFTIGAKRLWTVRKLFRCEPLIAPLLNLGFRLRMRTMAAAS
jgi:hypothetical protein